MGTPVEDLVARAAGLARGDDLPGALAALASSSTQGVDAAFSLARRRRSSDTSAAAAADLLEASALARRRQALTRTGPFPAPVVAVLALTVTNVGLIGHREAGWTGVAVGWVGLAVVLTAVMLVARREGWWQVRRLDPDGTGRASELAAGAVSTVDDGHLDDAVAIDRLRSLGRPHGIAGPVLALAALHTTDLTTAGWGRADRRRARSLTAAAREAIVADDLDGTDARTLRRLARHGRP